MHLLLLLAFNSTYINGSFILIGIIGVIYEAR